MTTADCYRESAHEFINEIQDIIKGIEDTEHHQIIGGIEFEITDHGDIFFQSSTASGSFRMENKILTPIYFESRDGHVRYNYHQGKESVSFYSKEGEVVYRESM
jgi:hypothetical protein